MLDICAIRKLGYADFVGFIGQDNTPPGGMSTIQRWTDTAMIDSQSTILDLASSTGFSGRNVARFVGASVRGIDVSTEAIAKANQKVISDGLSSDRIRYLVGNAENLPFDDSQFSHILAGCTFGFFSNREKALAECYRVGRESCQLCIATFYYHTRPPENLLDRVKEKVDFRPNSEWSRTWWNLFFSRSFVLESESYSPLTPVSTEMLRESVESSIAKSAFLQGYPTAVLEYCIDRLFNIRLVLNEHRKYQGCQNAVWRKKIE